MNDPTPMQVLISNVGEWVTAAAGYMGNFATAVTNNAVLTLCVVAVPLVGTGIGLFKRAIRA